MVRQGGLPFLQLDIGRDVERCEQCFWKTLVQRHPCPPQTGVLIVAQLNPLRRGQEPCTQADTKQCSNKHSNITTAITNGSEKAA